MPIEGPLSSTARGEDLKRRQGRFLVLLGRLTRRMYWRQDTPGIVDRMRVVTRSEVPQVSQEAVGSLSERGHDLQVRCPRRRGADGPRPRPFIEAVLEAPTEDIARFREVPWRLRLVLAARPERG